MAGTIHLALSQQFNELGEPLRLGRLYFYAAGTSTPQDAFQDTDLSIEHPNPITLDAAGRVPMFYLADGQIKIRLTDVNGVTQINADNILVVGASSGGGGGGSVDDTRLWQTGDIKDRYGTGAHSGWARFNGRTIGSATSGATERANADCENLFNYLWQNDANLSVSGGRGASSAADWAANKTITLPDGRGKANFAADDMGNSAASVLTTTYFGTGTTTLGAVGGAQNITIAQANLPSVNFTGTASVTSSLNTVVTAAAPNGFTANVAAPGGSFHAFDGGPSTGSIASTGTASVSSGGSGTALSRVPPGMIITRYIKL